MHVSIGFKPTVALPITQLLFHSSMCITVAAVQELNFGLGKVEMHVYIGVPVFGWNCYLTMITRRVNCMNLLSVYVCEFYDVLIALRKPGPSMSKRGYGIVKRCMLFRPHPHGEIRFLRFHGTRGAGSLGSTLQRILVLATGSSTGGNADS